MIETIIMLVSLVVLGYAFYISSRMFWVFKSRGGIGKLIYGAESLFLIITYFIFSIILFSFITSAFISLSILNIVNIITGAFFLSSAGLIGAVMRYHISEIGRTKAKSAKAGVKLKEVNKEKLKLKKELEVLEGDLNHAQKLNKLNVDRELKIIELEKKIEELEKKKSGRKRFDF